MPSRLFWKLFALQLAAALLLLGCALLVMSRYAADSFSGFVEMQQRHRLQENAQRIAVEYQGGRDLRRAADAVLPRQPLSLGEFARPPQGGPPPPRRGPPPLQVQSPDGAFVAGARFTPPPHGVLRVEIRAGEKLVGHLLQPRSPVADHPELAAFRRQQQRTLWLIVAGALLLAALTAAATAGLILQPIRRLSSAAAALARREFGTRLAVSSRDELGSLAQDFNRLADALERFDQRQQQWLADVAHELRTPLAILRGELEALIEGVRPLDLQRARSLHQEVLRLSALTDDLHLLSLADSGGLGLQREPVSLGELVTDSAARFRERFAAKGYSLDVTVPEPDRHVRLDAQRMEQVIANLLENVLRHAKPGPVQLGAAVTPKQASIHVEDSGPGVPDAALPRLFDRLFRVDRARNRSDGGSGLGLAICRSIVQAHGGQIVARKSAAGGLDVVISLPLESP